MAKDRLTPEERLNAADKMLWYWEQYLRSIQYLAYAFLHVGNLQKSEACTKFFQHEFYEGSMFMGSVLQYGHRDETTYVERWNSKTLDNQNLFIELVGDDPNTHSKLIKGLLSDMNKIKEMTTKKYGAI